MKPAEINQGVFVELMATQTRKSAFETFVNREHMMNSSFESEVLIEEYIATVNSIQRELELASLLEELIMLHRAKNNIRDIKISLLREYIYVRMNCYRPNLAVKDVRVIVGTTSQYGDDVDALFANVDFMDKAKQKIEVQIDEMIQDKQKELNHFYGIPTHALSYWTMGKIIRKEFVQTRRRSFRCPGLGDLGLGQGILRRRPMVSQGILGKVG